jgi:hypothetical protein
VGGAEGAGLGGWLWEERANVVGVLSLIVTVAFSILTTLLTYVFFYIPREERQLEINPAHREHRADQLKQPRWVTLYCAWLTAALDRLDCWMGPPNAWAQGFQWCLITGLVYSFGFMLLAWLFGASATIGEMTLLPDLAGVPLADRLKMAIPFVGAVSLGFLAGRYGKRIDARIDAALSNNILHPMIYYSPQAVIWARRSIVSLFCFF